MAGKDVLDCLLLLGCEAGLTPQCPVVPALPQGGYDLLLDLLCRGMGKGVKHSLYAPGQLDGLVAAEGGARRSPLGIAGWVDNRQEGLVRGPLLVGEMPQALRGLGAGVVLAQGELRGDCKAHGVQYSIGSIKCKSGGGFQQPTAASRFTGVQRSASVGTRWNPPPTLSFIGLYCE